MIENLFTFVRTLGNQRIQGKKFFVTQVGLLGTVSDNSGSIGTAGKVLSSTGSGVSWITVGTGSSDVATLNDLTDVVISTATEGQLLRFNGTSWVNWAPNFLTGYGSLNDLSDVTLTVPVNGSRLVYVSATGQWIDAAPLAFGKMYYGSALGDAATTSVITNGTKLSIGTATFSTNLNVGQVDITTGIAGQGSIHIGAIQDGSTYLLASNNKIQVGSQTEMIAPGDPGEEPTLAFTFTPSTLNIQPLGGDTVFGGYTTATGYKTPAGNRQELLTAAGTKTLTNSASNGQILRWIQPVGGVGNWQADDENTASTPNLDAVTDVGSTTTNSITVGNLSTSGTVTAAVVTTPLIERQGVLTINSEEPIDQGDPNPNLLYVSWYGDNKFVINADGYAIANTGYKVTGGTASGFLKANGTVDTSAYITAIDYLDDIGDVALISPATGDVLTFDGTEWVNSPIDSADYVSKVQHEVKAGVAITKGQALYVTGADGTNMVVGKASNVSEAMSSKTIGLAAASAAVNGKFFVITEGLLDGLNTSAANVGDAVWLGVNGALIFGLTNKPVAPAHLVYIGVVTRKNANNGEIFISIQNGFELKELHDVLINGVTAGQLIRREADGLWKNWTPNYITANSADTLLNKTIPLGTGIATIVNIDSIDPFVGESYIPIYQDGINKDGTISVDLEGSISISNPGIGYYSGQVNTEGGSRFLITITGNLVTGTLSEFNQALTDGTFATESYVGTQISNLVDSAPSTLNTLNELAAALGDDANFATTVTTSIATKQPQLNGTGFVKASGTTISYDNNTYLTSESDPLFTSSAAYEITGENLSEWGQAYGWGDHATQGYLTSETDPVFTASPAYGIAESNITKWNTAYGWGDHSTFGYLTSLPAHTHAASDITSGTLSTDRLPKQELGISIAGNFGQWEPHGTYTNFNTDVAYWGWSYVQGTGNAPHTTSSQWYRGRFSLGSQYGLGSGGGDYWMEIAIPRYSQGNNAGNLFVRTAEDGVATAWQGVRGAYSTNAGYAISSGNSETTDQTVFSTLFINDAAVATEHFVTSQGYINGESDPVFTGSVAYTITSENITKWDEAYGWGNHADYGYIAGETDTLDTVLSRGASTTRTAEFYQTSNTFINTVAAGNRGLTVFQNTAGADAYITFHIGGDYAGYFGLGGAENDLVWGGWSVGNARHRILHSGNFTDNSADWNAAYDWGNHSIVGYLTALPAHSHTIGDITGLQTALDGKLSTSGKAADSELIDGIDSSSILWGNARGTNDSLTTDADGLDKTGFYTSSAFVTRPESVDNWMYIQHIKLYNSNSHYQKQIGYDTYDDRMWVRTKSGNTWSSWKAILTSENIGEYTLTSLPAHTHTIANVTGLQTALDGKLSAESDTLDSVTGRDATTTNAITVGLLIAKGPGGNYNENIRLPGSTAVISFNTTGDTGVGSYNIVSQTNFQIRNAEGAQVFVMNQSGDLTIGGTFTEQSSIRYKENVKSIPSVSQKMEQLDAVSYNKIGSNQEEIGLIAEDVAELFPEVVKYDNEGRPDGVNYSRLSVILLKAVQELTERVNKLENK
jgi:hypothetical protein